MLEARTRTLDGIPPLIQPSYPPVSSRGYSCTENSSPGIASGLQPLSPCAGGIRTVDPFLFLSIRYMFSCRGLYVTAVNSTIGFVLFAPPRWPALRVARLHGWTKPSAPGLSHTEQTASILPLNTPSAHQHPATYGTRIREWRTCESFLRTILPPPGITKVRLCLRASGASVRSATQSHVYYSGGQS